MSPSRRKAVTDAKRITSAERGSSNRRPSVKPTTGVSPAADRVDIDYERLKSLTKVIQLQTIVVAEGGVRSSLDPRRSVDLVGQRGYALSLGDARWWLEGSTLDISLGYRIAGLLNQKSERTELFTLTVRFVASYVVPDGATVLAEDREGVMADMVAANGQINVFPYLRQLVVDLTSRTGWPPLLLNVFKAPASRPRSLVRMARAWDSEQQ